MDSPPTSDPQPASTPHRSRTLLWLALFALALVGIVTSILVFTPSENEKLTWLSPAEAAGTGKPGVFTEFKRKLIGLTAPLWRWYHRRPRPSVMINASILTLSPAAASQVALGAPSATNQDGSHAWILSATEAHDLQQRLKTNAGTHFLSSPRVQSGEGVQASLQVGSAVPVGAGKYAHVGTAVNVTANIAPGAVRLVLGVSSTETANPASGTSVLITTNFDVACRVLVPQNGAIVINSPPSHAPGTNDYWIIVSPTALDPYGKALPP